MVVSRRDGFFELDWTKYLLAEEEEPRSMLGLGLSMAACCSCLAMELARLVRGSSLANIIT